MRSTIGILALSLILASLGCSNGNGAKPPAASGTGGKATSAGGTGGAGTGGVAGTGGGAGTGGSFAVTWRSDPAVSPLFIGSGGFAYAVGSCSVSATTPNGLVKVGPDTNGSMGQIIHYSGYWYGDDTIQGFSHLHLSGTGATDYGVLAFMPSDGFDASRTTRMGYGSPFQKANESAVPGRYAVTLDRGGIAVELTATPHAAHHRYTYPSGAPANGAHVIFDLDHHLDSGSISSATFTLDAASNSASGSLHSMGGMSGGFGGYDVFFEIRTKSAWNEAQVWQAGMPPAAGTTATGTGVGFELGFDPSQGPIEIQVGVSMVSNAAAAANLTAEMPMFAFDATQQETEAAWAALMGRVKFTGGTAEQQAIMTAAMYHSFLMPSVQSDVDGGFLGMDKMVHNTGGSWHYQSDMSLWDTYRTLNSFYVLVAPEVALDSVLSLTEKAKDGGFFPKWPIAWGEAGTMIGSSAEIVLGDAYVKGITQFDAEGAYQIMRAAAMDTTAPPGGRGGRDQVVPYMQYGYVPADTGGSSVSLTTEYANDDFGLAALAAGLGHTADAMALQTRATGYRKLCDTATGLLWSKKADGTWATSHADPTVFSDEFREANGWQSAWMVSLDWDGLAMVASKDKLIATLEQLFELTLQSYPHIDWTSALSPMRPYYWAGNEPDINAVYLFAHLGRPDLTQKWVAWLRASWYTAGADGLPGNDDGGTMSAWMLWSSLGFYPLAGSDRYVVGAPLFPKAEIAVSGGTFTVEAPGVSDTNIYVQSAQLNGAPLAKAELTHADLKAGGTLSFVMGPKPSNWAQTP